MNVYSYQDPAIEYTGRWSRESICWPGQGECMTAAVAGSFFTFCYTGGLAVLRFDMNYLQPPFPHIWLEVDGGMRTEATLDRYLRVNAPDEGPHTVRVILKGMVEMFPRWERPLTNRISLLGIEAEALCTVKKPRRRKKTVEFVGDSITEGVLIDEECRYYPEDQYNRPTQDDVCATYAWLLAEKLGMTPWMMGYGAVGVTRGGCGGVPAAADAYPYCFDKVPTVADHPDYVFINHGTNDWGVDTVTFTNGYVRLLDAILTAHPKTQIIAMSPFCGAHEEDIERLVAEYNERHKQHILFVNGSHWLPVEPIHPGRDGHRLAAEKLYEALKDVVK